MPLGKTFGKSHGDFLFLVITNSDLGKNKIVLVVLYHLYIYIFSGIQNDFLFNILHHIAKIEYMKLK